MRAKRVVIWLLLLLSCQNFVNAQNNDSVPESGYVQMSLFYPLGTSWKSSRIKTYNFSLNLINGITGGVNGVEIGIIANITLGKFNGMQLGSINVVKGRFKGFQVGMLVNMNQSSSQGFQLAGLWTHNQGDFTGFQFS